ncbi:MAG: NeuD/PglB/VioB family sugar acetyltransferase [Desulfococcaceae bacterium]
MNHNEKSIAIYGASGFGRELAWLIQSCAKRGMNYHVACFIDDNEKKQGTVLNNIPVLSLAEAKKQYPGIPVSGGIGNPKIREILMNKAAEQGFGFETVIHPDTQMSEWIEIGKGTVICAGNILTSNIRIGCHVQINLDCTIGHDVVMGDYTTLAPGVHVSGWVHFGKRVYVGTGAVIINGTEENPLVIEDDAVIGAGACVTKSVPAGETWGGGTGKAAEKEITQNTRFDNWKFPEIEEGKPTKYNWVVQHKDNLALGYKTDIGAFTYINAKYVVIIEDFVQIGSHCSVYSVSTIDNKQGQVILKKNCRIGSHTVIMPGLTVGENAVVGAHSFVNRDIPDNVTAAGVPAKIIRGI